VGSDAFGRAEETRVEKPWGYEIRWAVTDRYLGKIIHVTRGEALSLQYHERKDECLLIVSGRLDMELDGDDGELSSHRLEPGDTVRVRAGRRHRMTAVEDTDIFEVSSPEIDDVVRLEDRYGRAPAAVKPGGATARRPDRR
jgi:mannose-6-phosphate isomerase-like protein (cupin superfamily)